MGLGKKNKKIGGFICSKDKTCMWNGNVEICFHQLANSFEHALSETSVSVDATYTEFCDVIMHEMGHALSYKLVENVRSSPSMDIASLGANVTRWPPQYRPKATTPSTTSDGMRTNLSVNNIIRRIKNSDAWAVRYVQYHNDAELFQILGLFSDGDTLYLNKLSDFALTSTSGKKVRISHSIAGHEPAKNVEFGLREMWSYIKSITVEPEFYRKLLEVYGVSAEKYMENARNHEASLEGVLVPYTALKE